MPAHEMSAAAGLQKGWHGIEPTKAMREVQRLALAPARTGRAARLGGAARCCSERGKDAQDLRPRRFGGSRFVAPAVGEDPAMRRREMPDGNGAWVARAVSSISALCASGRRPQRRSTQVPADAECRGAVSSSPPIPGGPMQAGRRADRLGITRQGPRDWLPCSIRPCRGAAHRCCGRRPQWRRYRQSTSPPRSPSWPPHPAGRASSCVRGRRKRSVSEA
jgi:hypothetical protein